MKKGFFLTFEGSEGSGKSTHSVLLADYLSKQGYDVIHTREPGGTSLAESLRDVLLDPQNKIQPLAELLLYEASRAQHTLDLILPALNSEKIVICDRYIDATVAYQGFGRNLNLGIIKKLNKIATQNLVPDLTILMDISVEKGLDLARNLNKNSYMSGDRLEREDISFHQRVRNGYLKIAKKESKRIKIVSNGRSIEETHKEIIQIVEKIMVKRKIKVKLIKNI